MSDTRAIELALIERVEPLALQCPDGEFDWDSWVMVDEFSVLSAARCPASVAAPPEEFEPSIFTTFKALAKEAARGVGRHQGDVRGALMEVVAKGRAGDPSVPTWLAEYLWGCDTPELVAVVHRAASWLERTLGVLDVADFDRYVIDNRYSWDHPAGGLRLRGKIDLVEEGTARPVLVLPSIDDSRLEQAGYLGLLHGLGRSKAAPESIVLISHATGAVQSYDRRDLADRALDAVERAVEAVMARATGPAGLARRPSFFTCRSCHWFDDCEPRRAAEAQPSVVRRGIRLG